MNARIRFAISVIILGLLMTGPFVITAQLGLGIAGAGERLQQLQGGRVVLAVHGGDAVLQRLRERGKHQGSEGQGGNGSGDRHEGVLCVSRA